MTYPSPFSKSKMSSSSIVADSQSLNKSHMDNYSFTPRQEGCNKISVRYLSLCSLRRRFISIGIPIINLRRSSDRLRVYHGDPYTRKTASS